MDGSQSNYSKRIHGWSKNYVDAALKPTAVCLRLCKLALGRCHSYRLAHLLHPLINQ